MYGNWWVLFICLVSVQGTLFYILNSMLHNRFCGSKSFHKTLQTPAISFGLHKFVPIPLIGKKWRDVIRQHPGHSHGYKSIAVGAFADNIRVTLTGTNQ